MEASVPVFGNCCLDLPADSDGVSEDTVSIDADALVDSDSEAGVLALVDADSEAEVDTEVLIESEAITLAISRALLE